MSIHLGHGKPPPDCRECRKWIYGSGWVKSLRDDKPIARPAHIPPPCRTCPKSKDGKPNPGADMRGRNWLAYRLYQTVQAGLAMPEDSIVVQNCAMIHEVESFAARQRGDVGLLLKKIFGGR